MIILHFISGKNLGGYSIGVHLLPFRTEKLRPIAQMVLPFWWESMSLPILYLTQLYAGFFFEINISLGDLFISKLESL